MYRNSIQNFNCAFTPSLASCKYVVASFTMEIYACKSWSLVWLENFNWLAVLEEQKAAIQKEANELRSTLREVEKARLDARRELQELRRQVSALCLLDFLTYRKTLSQGDRHWNIETSMHSNIENTLMLTGIVDQCVLCDEKSNALEIIRAPHSCTYQPKSSAFRPSNEPKKLLFMKKFESE